ncbi:MAG TPA: zinc ribbon domain-containing protein, partial [Rudaea sp.]|nr:zinc ribbon domain-containing protein [Rudaea sp.]
RMPIYEYAATNNGCAHCEGHFDVLQKLHDDALTQCPECGAAIVRIISAPSIASGQSHLLKESHVAKHGFTQYRRAGKGVYEKTTGKGPQFISGD